MRKPLLATEGVRSYRSATDLAPSSPSPEGQQPGPARNRVGPRIWGSLAGLPRALRPSRAQSPAHPRAPRPPGPRSPPRPPPGLQMAARRARHAGSLLPPSCCRQTRPLSSAGVRLAGRVGAVRPGPAGLRSGAGGEAARLHSPRDPTFPLADLPAPPSPAPPGRGLRTRRTARSTSQPPAGGAPLPTTRAAGCRPAAATGALLSSPFLALLPLAFHLLLFARQVSRLSPSQPPFSWGFHPAGGDVEACGSSPRVAREGLRGEAGGVSVRGPDGSCLPREWAGPGRGASRGRRARRGPPCAALPDALAASVPSSCASRGGWVTPRGRVSTPPSAPPVPPTVPSAPAQGRPERSP